MNYFGPWFSSWTTKEVSLKERWIIALHDPAYIIGLVIFACLIVWRLI